MSTNAPKSKPATSKFFNRELSWLAFNERVLDQAFSDKYPLLERTRFLSFVSSNLDQFSKRYLNSIELSAGYHF